MGYASRATRKVRPSEAAEQLRGGRRLSPGLWVDRDGHAHVAMPELLAHLGIVDTPETRREATEIVRRVLCEVTPATVEIVEQELVPEVDEP
jgi:hypothetical protein